MRFDELKENYFIDEQSEKRNSVRYHILNSSIVFGGMTFEVLDISKGGFAVNLTSHSQFELFQPRVELEAILVLPIGQYPIMFETKRRNPSTMTAGFSFRSIPGRSKEAIMKSFDMIILSHGMRLMKLSEKERTWLHSDTGSDFIFHFENGQLNSFTIFLQKEFISWSEKGGLNTGKIAFNFKPKDVSEELLNKKLNNLIPDKGVSILKVKRLANFVKSNKTMQQKLKDWVLEKLV